MKKPQKLLLALVAGLILAVTVAATTKPAEKITVWEYRVIKEDGVVPGPLTDVLNMAATKGWMVDAFSSHSTGNGERSVVIPKRQRQIERSK